MGGTSSRARAKEWPYPRRVHFQRQMQDAAASWFAERGYPVRSKQKYILANPEDWPKNIILPEVVEQINTIKADHDSRGHGFALHKYLHHGLSSQAMIFNLIVPLMVRDDLVLLNDALTRIGLQASSPVSTAILEYEDRSVFNEDSGQPTSIDLVLGDDTRSPLLFVEFKFTESEFGGCSVFASGDCDGRNPAANPNLCYLHFIGREYWIRLWEQGFLAGPIASQKLCILAQYYQFFRVLLFALHHDRPFVLMYDECNPAFVSQGTPGVRGLVPFLMTFVPDKHQDKVGLLSIQDVVHEIKASGHHSWVAVFEKKYGLT